MTGLASAVGPAIPVLPTDRRSGGAGIGLFVVGVWREPIDSDRPQEASRDSVDSVDSVDCDDGSRRNLLAALGSRSG